MRRLPFFPAIACGLLGMVAGCVVYDPGLVTQGNGCGRHQPARPTIDDTSEPGVVSFGLRDVVLDQGAMWREIGYDLDCRNSTPTNPLTECTVGGAVPPDGVEGIDNQFGAVFYPLVASVVMGLEDRARMAQMEGRGLPILRISGWNGTRNDPVIDISITAAVFSTAFAGDTPPTIVINGPDDQTLPGGGAVPAPIWDGNDWTWVRSDSFLGGDVEQPLVRDPQAYIVDGVLVASLPERVDIVFPTDTVGVLVRLTGAVATGRLSDDGTQLEEVVVAGRWAITDLLDTAENIGVCRGDVQYGILETQLHRVADLRTRPTSPGDPVIACDALSIGVRFTGYRMRIAGVTEGLAITNICAADGGVPDATAGDAGSVDAGAVDAGSIDAAASDVGIDAGAADAGVDADHDAS
jgi:hypothetical protein